MSRLAMVWAKFNKHLQRALYLLSLASFLLPFVTVEGCESGKTTEYAGYQLLGEDSGWVYLIPIGLGLMFLALSFLRQPGNVIARGFISSMKALLAFASEYVVGLFPYVQFAPDTVHARTGQYVASVSWALVYAIGLGSTLIAVRRASLVKHPAGAGLRRPSRFIFWPLVAVTLGLFGVSIASSLLEKMPGIIVLFGVFALSLYFALPFAERELAAQGWWAVAWVVATTLLLVTAIVLSLLLTAPFVLFVIPVLATIIGVAGLAGGYFSPWGRRSVDAEQPTATWTEEDARGGRDTISDPGANA